MADDGIRRALAFVTSAYSSYSSCRQYQEDIARARGVVGGAAPLIEKLRPYWNHPGFIEPMAAAAAAGLAQFAAVPHVLFTAHSLPTAMASGCDYVAQLTDAARLVVDAVGPDLGWDLVYQSRSGPPTQPWLEPDVNDRLRGLAAEGVRRVLLVPIGFVADHMEVRYDLDTQAAATAAELGVQLVRAATPGSAPRFVAMIRELVLERTAGAPAVASGPLGPRSTPCAPDCCRHAPGEHPR
jgi:ferrochelatase